MKVRLAILIVLLTFAHINKVEAQLFVTEASALPGWNADSLVRNILLDNGLSISNAKYNGSTDVINCNSIGVFETGWTATNLGLTSGLIIASGGVTVAVGPNNNGGTSIPTTCSEYSDSDLSNIASDETHNVAVLEFDFIPWSDTLSFRFVFGSEEYLEYVGSLYNDVFGFFLEGLNPAGGVYNHQNMALIPGTNSVVSINNVNLSSNGAYFVNNAGGQSIQFDGFTIPIEVSFAVVPMTSYHIKFAICDVMDNEVDSGVFIEAQSFTTNFTYNMSIDTLLYNSIPDNYYFCSNHVIEFNTLTDWHYDDVVWYFGDGTSSTGADVTHVYEHDGFYDVMNVLHNPHRSNDSIYLTKTIEIRSMHSESEATICKGEPYTWNGKDYYNSGIFIDTLDSYLHCDSIVTLRLTVYDSDTTELNVFQCEPYTWQGQTYYESGRYYSYEQNIHGCDSILVLNLDLDNGIYLEESATACDKYPWEPAEGGYLTESGHYRYEGVTASGCDSVIDLDLTINHTPNLLIVGMTQVEVASSLCPGMYNYFIADSLDLSGCTINWTCSEPNWLLLPNTDPYCCTILVKTLGDGILTATTDCSFGCDAEYSIEIHSSNYGVDELDTDKIKVYPNPANNSLNIEANSFDHVKMFNIYGQVVKDLTFDKTSSATIDVGDLSDGIYIIEISASYQKTIQQIVISK